MQHQTLISLSAPEILETLNRALVAERQAATDYCAHALASKRLHVREALEALGEVELDHADRLAARIVALGGSPAAQEPGAGAAAAGDTVASWLAHDLAGEQWAIVEYARMVACITEDAETAELMAELLEDEIRHARWLKATLQSLAAVEL